MRPKLPPACEALSLAWFAEVLMIDPAACRVEYGRDKQGRSWYRCRDPTGWDGGFGWFLVPGQPPKLPKVYQTARQATLETRPAAG